MPLDFGHQHQVVSTANKIRSDVSETNEDTDRQGATGTRLRKAEGAITEHLVEVFAEVVRTSADAKGPTDGSTEVSKILNREGGAEQLLEQCDQVSAHHRDPVSLQNADREQVV